MRCRNKSRFCYSDYMAQIPESEFDREDAPTGEKRSVIVTVSDEALWDTLLAWAVPWLAQGVAAYLDTRCALGH